jgi:hypothetical protein
LTGEAETGLCFANPGIIRGQSGRLIYLINSGLRSTYGEETLSLSDNASGYCDSFTCPGIIGGTVYSGARHARAISE